MPETTRCPVCSRPLPPGILGGLCPTCLLQGFLDETPPPADTPRAPPTASRPRRKPKPSSGSIEPKHSKDLPDRFASIEILDLLGEGGMGRVFRARQAELDRTIALKVMHSGLAESREFARRFLREARTLARLSHPNIVAVYDFGRSDGLLYLAMEFVEGRNLRTILNNGPLEEADAIHLLLQLCSALQYAHDHGVIHRDIKPENILVDRLGDVKIADFGLAKLITDPNRPSLSLTVTGHQLGTPYYIAPEQLDPGRPIDHRADIFSLGVVFYEMLTGELPVGRFSPPSRLTDVDPRLDLVALRALEKDPDRRFQSAGELAEAVASLEKERLSQADGEDEDLRFFRTQCPYCDKRVKLTGDLSKRTRFRCPKCGATVPLRLSSDEPPRPSKSHFLYLGLAAILSLSLAAAVVIGALTLHEIPAGTPRDKAEAAPLIAAQPAAVRVDANDAPIPDPESAIVDPLTAFPQATPPVVTIPAASETKPESTATAQEAVDTKTESENKENDFGSARAAPALPDDSETASNAPSGNTASLPLLRYRLEGDHHYRVEIEGDHDTYIESYSGVLDVSPSRQRSGDLWEFRCDLFAHNKPKPGQLEHFRPSLMPFPDRRPFLEPPLIRLDERGSVLSASNEQSLPFSLGATQGLIFIPLPEPTTDQWEVDDRTMLKYTEYDESSITPWQVRTTDISAQRKRSYMARRTDDKTVSIQMKSLVKTDGGANLRVGCEITGEGIYLLDLELGMIRTASLSYLLKERRANVSISTPITVAVTRIEPEDKPDKTPPPPPKRLTELEVKQLVSQLASADFAEARHAADVFAEAEVTQDRETVAKALVQLLKSTDTFAQVKAAQALEKWHTESTVPTLMDALGHENAFVRNAALRILPNYRTAEVASGLANRLHEDRFLASDGLRKIGKPAEAAVREQLTHREERVRAAACEILREIGTKKSLDDLRETLSDSSLSVRLRGEQAIKAIEQRQQ